MNTVDIFLRFSSAEIAERRAEEELQSLCGAIDQMKKDIEAVFEQFRQFRSGEEEGLGEESSSFIEGASKIDGENVYERFNAAQTVRSVLNHALQKLTEAQSLWSDSTNQVNNEREQQQKRTQKIEDLQQELEKLGSELTNLRKMKLRQRSTAQYDLNDKEQEIQKVNKKISTKEQKLEKAKTSLKNGSSRLEKLEKVTDKDLFESSVQLQACLKEAKNILIEERTGEQEEQESTDLCSKIVEQVQSERRTALHSLLSEKIHSNGTSLATDAVNSDDPLEISSLVEPLQSHEERDRILSEIKSLLLARLSEYAGKCKKKKKKKKNGGKKENASQKLTPREHVLQSALRVVERAIDPEGTKESMTLDPFCSTFSTSGDPVTTLPQDVDSPITFTFDLGNGNGTEAHDGQDHMKYEDRKSYCDAYKLMRNCMNELQGGGVDATQSQKNICTGYSEACHARMLCNQVPINVAIPGLQQKANQLFSTAQNEVDPDKKQIKYQCACYLAGLVCAMHDLGNNKDLHEEVENFKQYVNSAEDAQARECIGRLFMIVFPRALIEIVRGGSYSFSDETLNTLSSFDDLEIGSKFDTLLQKVHTLQYYNTESITMEILFRLGLGEVALQRYKNK